MGGWGGGHKFSSLHFDTYKAPFVNILQLLTDAIYFFQVLLGGVSFSFFLSFFLGGGVCIFVWFLLGLFGCCCFSVIVVCLGGFCSLYVSGPVI